MDENSKPKPLKSIHDEALEDFKREVDYETKFFEIIAGTPNFEIIPIPCSDGSLLTVEEKLAINNYARVHNKKILYRISMGDHAIILGEDCNLIGICPEYDPRGFPC